jgi:hypothetical protein
VQQPDRYGLLDRGVGDGQLSGVGNRDHWSSAVLTPAGRVIAISDVLEGQGRMSLAHDPMMACSGLPGARRAGLEV